MVYWLLPLSCPPGHSPRCGDLPDPDAVPAPAAVEGEHPAAGLPEGGRLPPQDGGVL